MASKRYRTAVHHLQIDAVVLLLSIVFAYFLVQSGVFSHFLSFAQGLHLLGAFVAGIFFTSMFTTAAASVALAEIGTQGQNIWAISAIGALGAVCGDMVLFLFIRDTLSEDLKAVVKRSTYRKLMSYFHGGFFRLISPFVGGLIIASPLPDEAGLALMGMSKLRSYYVIPISFIMNMLGIWGIISIAKLI